MAKKKRSPKSVRYKKKVPSRSHVSSHKKRQKKAILATRGKILPRPSEPISHNILFDFLSEFLAAERGGIQLYSSAIERSTDPEMREKFERFLVQTRRHEGLLSDVITKLKGDINYKSPGAIAQENLAQAMVRIDVPPYLRELKDAENILLAETKDHLDWEFLGQIISCVKEDAKTLLSEIVDEVEQEKESHVSFAKEAVSKLALKVATSELTVGKKAA